MFFLLSLIVIDGAMVVLEELLKKHIIFCGKISQKEGYIKQPDSTAEWRNIGKEYETYWNFQNYVGAIDGKHVTSQCPA